MPEEKGSPAWLVETFKKQTGDEPSTVGSFMAAGFMEMNVIATELNNRGLFADETLKDWFLTRLEQWAQLRDAFVDEHEPEP